MTDHVSEIKSKLDIADVIREYVQLLPAGANLKGRCPFHNEKTPSFMVSRERQMFKCFGCGVGGDMFEFIKKIENCEFPEALRILAKKANVEITPQDPKIYSEKNRLADLMEKVTDFFHQNLLKSPNAEFVRAYLKKRGITDATVEDFKIGYAPDSWDATLNFLKSKGFGDKEIINAGIAISRNKEVYPPTNISLNNKQAINNVTSSMDTQGDYYKHIGGGAYDRFRNRLMFPINDTNGQVVGFSGRELDTVLGVKPKDEATAQAKYINSPQTLIYDKGHILFGLDKAKNAIKEKGFVIIVEGQMDMVACHQAGIKNTVASSGTALTVEQVKILKRYSNNFVASFDADLAGQLALKRGIDNALVQDVNVKVLEMPQDESGKPIAKDPDECLQKNPTLFIQAVANAKGFVDHYFDKLKGECNLSKVEDKKKMAKELLLIISKLVDRVEQSHYIKKLANILDVSEQDLRSALPKDTIKQYFTPPQAKAVNITLSGTAEERLLAIIIKYPENLDYANEHILPEMFQKEEAKQLYKQLIIAYTDSSHGSSDGKLFDTQNFKNSLDPDSQAYFNTVYFSNEKEGEENDEAEVQKELIHVVKSMKRDFIKKELKNITRLLGEAEKAGDKEKVKEVSDQFSELTEWLEILEQ